MSHPTAEIFRPKIFEAIPAAMKAIGSIGKDQSNKQQGFKYRGIDDVYNALHPILAAHGIFTATTVLEQIREERQTKNGTNMIYSILKVQFRFFADDGSYFDTVMIGEACDSGDKASNKAMAVAHKYALLQVFAIPTEEPKDPDAESHEFAARTNAHINALEANRGALTREMVDEALALARSRLSRIKKDGNLKDEDVYNEIARLFPSKRKVVELDESELFNLIEVLQHKRGRDVNDWS